MSPPPFTPLLLRGTALLLAVLTLLTLQSGAGIFAKEKIVYLAGSGALGVATLLFFGQLVIIAPIAVWRLWRRRPVWMRVATVLFGCGTAYFVALGIASSRAGMYWGLALYYLFGNIAGLCVGIFFIAVTCATRRHSLGGAKIGPKD